MKYLFVLLLSLLCVGLASGSVAVFDDDRVTITAPETITHPQIVDIRILSKQFTGNINILIGYDKDVVRLRDPVRYVETYEDAPFCDGTLTSGNGYVTCVDVNGTQTWTHTHLDIRPIPINKKPLRVDMSYDNKDTWFEFRDIPITATEETIFGFFMDFPPYTNAKYDIAFYPSIDGYGYEGALEAFQNDRLYLLDPFINATDSMEETWTFNNTLVGVYNSVTMSDLTPIYNSTESMSGDSISFYTDGAQYTDATNDVGLTTTTPRTYNAWVYPYVNTSGTVIRDRSDAGITEIRNLGAGWVVRAYDGSYHDAKCDSIAQDTWSMLTLVWNTTHIHCYNNAVLEGTNTTGSTLSAAGASTGRVGATEAKADDFVGNIDELSIWSRALNITDIEDLYNSGSGVFYPFSPPPSPTYNFTVTFKDEITGDTVPNSTIYLRVTGSGDTHYPQYAPTGVVVTNISNNHSSNWDTFGISNQSTPWGTPYLVNFTNNYDVSNNMSMYLKRQRPFFYITNVSKNDTGLNVSTYTAYICGNHFSTTNGTIKSSSTNETGLCNITITNISGYYDRTYTNFNVTLNLTGLVYKEPVITPEELDRDELILFIFIFLTISVIAFAGHITQSVILSSIALLSLLVLTFSVLTGDYFTSFESFRGLLVVIFTLFILAVSFSIFDIT